MRHLRTLAFVMLFAALLFVGWQGSVGAHELKEDNGVSAVLHIPPDDNPKSGQDTLLYFAFSSTNPEFNLGYCKCQVSYQATDNQLRAAAINPAEDDPSSGYATVNFARPGVYTITVRGMVATDPGNTFEISYRVRVSAGSSLDEAKIRKTASLQIILLSLTGIVIVGVVANEMIRRGDHYRKK